MSRFLSFWTLLFPVITQAQESPVLRTASRSEMTGNIISYYGVKADSVEKTYSITITVTNIRDSKGSIRFKFYDDSTPFPNDTGFLKVVLDKSEIIGTSFTRTYYGFKSQTMAIALLDDENNDNKMSMGWFFPREGHAFSDYYHSALRRPVYNDFKFVLTEDKSVVMKMKYY